MNLIYLARRSLARDLPMTMIQILGMGAVCAVLIVWSSFAVGFRSMVYGAATRLLLGEAQVHHESYMNSESIYDTVAFDDASARALAAVNFAVAPRLYSYALAAQANSSRGIKVVGIDPDRENKVSDIHNHLASGNFIDAGSKGTVSVGSDLAEALQLTVGGEIIIFGQAADGGLTSGIFKVAGILLPVNATVDQRHVYMNQADFRELFLVEKGVHELVLRHESARGVSVGADDLSEIRKIYPAASVQGWRELRPGLAGILDLLGYTLYGTLFFVYLALGSIILNMKLMAVLDRLREYGVMQAVGMGRGQIMSLIFTEAMLRALGACVVALALGIPGGLYLQQHGIDLSHLVKRIAYSEMMLEPVLYGHLGPWQVINPLLFLLVMAPLAALYPAWIASHIDPAQAISKGRSGR